MAKVEDNSRNIRGQYPFPSPFAVDEHDDCPSYLDSLTSVPDSTMPKFPPKGHLKNATENFDEAAWGYSETRRSMHQQSSTSKRKV